MAEVYWIHIPEHTDIFTEGYVGVSENSKKRYSAHVYMLENDIHENIHLSRAYNKYDAFIKDTVLVSDEEYCYEVEKNLRPEYNIGWNIAPGGSKPPTAQKGRGKGRYHSEEHKRNISKRTWFSVFNKTEERKILTSKTMKGVPKSQTQKVKQSKSMQGKNVGSKNGMSDPINRLKVSESKIGTVSLYKDGVRKMARPNSEKWISLVSDGFSPKKIGG